MLLVGGSQILAALMLALFDAHVRRMRAWDRPGFTRTWIYSRSRTPAQALLMVSGLACLTAFSPWALLAASAALAVLVLWRLRVRSSRHALARLRRDRSMLAGRHPAASDADLSARVLRSWHPEWPEEIVERVVADHPALEDLARMVVRLERDL